jgi:hypothetical protein
MTGRLRLDDNVYDTADLSAEAKSLLDRLAFVQGRLEELTANVALLNKAKNAYIEGLRLDLVRGRVGLNYGSLIGEE